MTRRSFWRDGLARWVMGRVPGLGLVALVSVGVPLAPVEAAAQQPDTDGAVVVYLVRHGERATDHPNDPSLSPAGRARARELARVLRDVPLDRILSTGYRRTLETGAPVAEEQERRVRLYEPRGEGMAELVRLLRSTPGHHLVVGHSNTTPQVVAALGGDPGPPIHESEYDRLYIVTLTPEGRVTSTLLRYGEAWTPEDEG